MKKLKSREQHGELKFNETDILFADLPESLNTNMYYSLARLHLYRQGGRTANPS